MSIVPSAARPSDEEVDVTADGDGLVSRLRVIEDQPLETRADAYTALHAELKTVLDSADRVAADRVGSDRAGSDRAGSDRSGSDRAGADRAIG